MVNPPPPSPTHHLTLVTLLLLLLPTILAATTTTTPTTRQSTPQPTIQHATIPDRFRRAESPTPPRRAWEPSGFYDGDVGRPLTPPYGKALVADEARRLWGFCASPDARWRRRDRDGAVICRLVGTCFDAAECGEGCSVGVDERGTGHATLECPDGACTTAVWARRDGALFTSLGCGTATTVVTIRELPTAVAVGSSTAVGIEVGIGGGLVHPAPSTWTEKSVAWTSSATVVLSVPPPSSTSSPSTPTEPASQPSPTRPTPATTHPSADTNPDSAGLSPGAIAGIVLGSLAAVCILATLSFLVIRHAVKRLGTAVYSIYKFFKPWDEKEGSGSERDEKFRD